MFEKLLGTKPTDQTNSKVEDNTPQTTVLEPVKETQKGVNPIWVTWKTDISREMSNEVKRVYRKHGFGTQAELVRYLLRQWLDSVKKEA